MRTLIHCFFAIVLVASSLPGAAQGLPSLPDVRKVTDGAMEKVGRGDIEAGLKSVRHLLIIPPAEFDAMLGQLPVQVPGMSARFGPSIGYEFIKEDKIGESVARLTYIHKFERHAMRWYFYCYKGKSGWVINTFRFDDKLHELFER
jgi:hypothetical protein